jgi:hypothetical protein
MDALARSLKASAGNFLHGLDVAQDRASFVRLTRPEIADASFLDDRILAGGPEPGWRPFAEVEAAVAEAELSERCHFIFHIGHVGSTLLSRLLDGDERVLGLREPLALRSLAAVHAGLGAPDSPWPAERFERRLAACLKLWSRTFEVGQTSVIKATSFCSEMAAGLLARPMRPRAILMFVPPEAFLASIFGADGNRHDVMAMAEGRLARLNRRLGGAAFRLADMTYAQIVAMAWACEMTALMAADGPQALWLDFEKFLMRPQSRLKAAFAHLGLDLPDEAVAAIVSGPVMGRYSKAPEHAYDGALRTRVLAQARASHVAEIRQGLDWLDRAARIAPRIAAAVQRASAP